MGLNVVFIELKCMRLQTSLADGLEKTLNMRIFSMGRFLRIFENITFFEFFENHL